ncbi:MAG: hypothetical protein SGI71_08930 [Verrucomicrobiota bacterium]|nr:hypothetical protein [Verrucomicrobiota bacterium]
MIQYGVDKSRWLPLRNSEILTCSHFEKVVRLYNSKLPFHTLAVDGILSSANQDHDQK